MAENNKEFISFKFETDLFDTLKDKAQDVTLKDSISLCLDVAIQPTKIASDILKKIADIKFSDWTNGIETVKNYFTDKTNTIKKDINDKTISNRLFNTQDTDFATDYYVPLQAENCNGSIDTVQKFLAEFANQKPKSNKIYHRIAFVCGSPGAGKSVEGRIFTLRQADGQKNKKFETFNPLKWFGSQSLDNEEPKLCAFIPLGSEYYSNQQETNKKVFSIPPATGIIYLDGLDEVHYQTNYNYDGDLKEGKVAVRILSAVGALLSNNPNLKVIIGLRKTLFDELKDISKEVGYGTNFNTLLQDCKNIFEILPLNHKDHDTRLEFAKKILINDSVNLEIFTKKLENTMLDDITSEPILLSFYLQSLKTQQMKNINNKSELYYAVFQNFFNREAPESCSKYLSLTKDDLEHDLPISQSNPFIKAICTKANNDFDDAFDIFHKILEIIALTVWQEQSDRMASRWAVIQAIQEYDTTDNTEFAQYFKQSDSSSEQAFGVIAFYFAVQENGNLEFLHKSFVEYFVACGYIRLIIQAAGGNKQSATRFKDITIANSYNDSIPEFVENAVSLPFVNKMITDYNFSDFGFFEKLLINYFSGEYPYHDNNNNYSNIMSLNVSLQSSRNIIVTLCMIYSFLFPRFFQKNKKQFWETNIIFTFLFSHYHYKVIASYHGENVKRYSKAEYSKSYFKYINLENQILIGIPLSNVNFTGANLKDIDVRGANLRETIFDDANLEGAYLGRVTLHENHLKNVNLKKSSLSLADLSYVIFENCNLEGVDLKGAYLKGVKMINTTYNANTKFPNNFNPKAHGMIEVEVEGIKPEI